MAKPLVTDELWEVIEPLLPEEPPKPKGGRPRVPDRATLTGASSSCSGRASPGRCAPPRDGLRLGHDLCWRRLEEWHEAGVWEDLHQALLDRLGQEEEQIDWERASLDSAAVPAPGGTKSPGLTRRTGANRARSAMLWSSVRASR
jgi:transposase